MNVSRRCGLLPLALLAFASCASPPPVAQAPPLPAPVEPAPPPPIALGLAVVADRAVNCSLSAVSVTFTVVVKNEDQRPAEMISLDWEVSVDGTAAARNTVSAGVRIEGGASVSFPVECSVAVPPAARGSAAFAIRAAASRRVPDGSLLSSAEAAGSFPVLREPRFSVRSIKIKKADLINTRLEVVLRVENPNAVPLRLSALEYELFGARRLWTDGATADVIPVAPNGMTDKKLLLMMNFINMKRELLDQVIRLQVVDYRFKGQAKIAVDVPAFPEFLMPYDLEGRTSVVD